MKKILVVTKDGGGFNVTYPIVEKSKDEFNFKILAEGVSRKKWLTAGYRTEPIGLDLAELNPDLVVCTSGSPINLENFYAQRANELDIPLVVVEDFWGVHRRIGAVPACICTLDNFGVRLVKDSSNRRYTKAVASGSPAFDNLFKYSVFDFAKERRKLNLPLDKNILLFASPGFANDTLEIMQALEMILGQSEIVLIPRLHPKLKEVDPEGWSRCEEIISNAGQKVVLRSSADIDDLVFCSDFVISTYSTVLLVAAYLRRVPISYFSEGVKENLKMEVDLEEFPLNEMNCSFRVESAREILRIIRGDFPSLRQNQEREFVLDGRNTERVTEVIRGILD